MMVARKEASGMETEFDEIDKGPESEVAVLEGHLTSLEKRALAFIEFTKADEKENLIAAADAELRQQKADIERQRMEEELVRVAADEEEDQDEGTEDDSD